MVCKSWITSCLSQGKEEMWLMAGTVAPKYGYFMGRGSYETSLPGLMQLCPLEWQCCSEAELCLGTDVRCSESGPCTTSCPAIKKDVHSRRSTCRPWMPLPIWKCWWSFSFSWMNLPKVCRQDIFAAPFPWTLKFFASRSAIPTNCPNLILVTSFFAMGE